MLKMDIYLVSSLTTFPVRDIAYTGRHVDKDEFWAERKQGGNLCMWRKITNICITLTVLSFIYLVVVVIKMGVYLCR